MADLVWLKSVSQTDGCFVDRAGLDHVGAFGGDLFRSLFARAHDGDVAGPIVVVIMVACHHELPAVGSGLRLIGIGELHPAARRAFFGEQFVLRIASNFWPCSGGRKI